ncbi:MAG: hypothetical protein ACK4M1_11240 [Flavobacterium sp.]
MDEKEIFELLYRDSAQTKLDSSKRDLKFGVKKSFRKYQDVEYGINPTIQVQVQYNAHENFEDFFKSQSDEANYFLKYFKSAKFIEAPKKISIDGIESIHYSLGYEKTLNDSVYKVRVRAYLIPNGETLFQITLNDSEDRDCSKTYDSIVKTICLNKNHP